MFVVCGEALWDLFGAEVGHGLEFDARVGGSPFNVAVGLARLGQDAALLGGLSTDPLGERLAAALETEGVRTDLLIRSDRPTTLSIVNVSPNGQPVYSFYGTGAADRMITTEDLPELNPDVWGLHAGSFSIVTEPVGQALLALYAREKGRRLLTLDPNVRLNVEPDQEVWRSRISQFVRHADLVKVSDEDLASLYADVTANEVAERWLAHGAGVVVVTHGENGAQAFTKDGCATIPGRQISVVDTVGAGDSFQAALICRLAERAIQSRHALDAMTEDEIGELVAFAATAASITCTRRGADLPHRAELPAVA